MTRSLTDQCPMAPILVVTLALLMAGCSPSRSDPAATARPLVAEPGTESAGPAAQPVVTPKARVTPEPAAAPYYANCAAVRSAGKAPLHRGDPGYRSALDRDNDGLACE